MVRRPAGRWENVSGGVATGNLIDVCLVGGTVLIDGKTTANADAHLLHLHQVVASLLSQVRVLKRKTAAAPMGWLRFLCLRLLPAWSVT